eukprot:365835-Chlamydomonas_euryale.AAC.7
MPAHHAAALNPKTLNPKHAHQPPNAHARAPRGRRRSDHFFAKFVAGTPQCLEAQRAFTESLAGYSIITYLLQVGVDV